MASRAKVFKIPKIIVFRKAQHLSLSKNIRFLSKRNFKSAVFGKNALNSLSLSTCTFISFPNVKQFSNFDWSVWGFRLFSIMERYTVFIYLKQNKIESHCLLKTIWFYLTKSKLPSGKNYLDCNYNVCQVSWIPWNVDHIIFLQVMLHKNKKKWRLSLKFQHLGNLSKFHKWISLTIKWVCFFNNADLLEIKLNI